MKRILLIKRGALGDILMTTPLVRQLRIALPNSQIDYCIAKSFIQVLQDNKNLDNVFTLDEDAFSIKGIFKFIKFAFSKRKEYDYIFNLGKSWQLNLLCKIFSGIKIGYVREKISKLFLDKYVIYNDITRYHGLYYLDLLGISGIIKANYDDLTLDLAISDVNKQLMSNKLKPLGDFVVVVNSGGNNQYESGGIRMLPENKILELLTGLLKAQQKIILIGGTIDRDNYIKYTTYFGNSSNLLNWAGQLSLSQSLYVIRKAKRFYTTDCGAMHLGVVAKLEDRMISFFSPTHPAHSLPSSYKYKVYRTNEEDFDENYSLCGKLPRNKKIRYFSDLNIDTVVKSSL